MFLVQKQEIAQKSDFEKFCMKIEFQTKKTSDSESSRKTIMTDGKISFWRASGAQLRKKHLKKKHK